MKSIVVMMLIGLVSLSPSEEITFVSPVDENFEVTSLYGMRFHPILQYERLHNGIDWAVPEGTQVYAAASGKVSYSDNKGILGRIVIIEHGSGFETMYAHLSSAAEGLKVGDEVEQGEIIALSGKSGLSDKPHLHFMITLDGEIVDPADYLNLEK